MDIRLGSFRYVEVFKCKVRTSCQCQRNVEYVESQNPNFVATGDP